MKIPEVLSTLTIKGAISTRNEINGSRQDYLVKLNKDGYIDPSLLNLGEDVLNLQDFSIDAWPINTATNVYDKLYNITEGENHLCLIRNYNLADIPNKNAAFDNINRAATDQQSGSVCITNDVETAESYVNDFPVVPSVDAAKKAVYFSDPASYLLKSILRYPDSVSVSQDNDLVPKNYVDSIISSITTGFPLDSAVALVSSAATGSGSLGSFSDPFPAIEDAWSALVNNSSSTKVLIIYPGTYIITQPLTACAVTGGTIWIHAFPGVKIQCNSQGNASDFIWAITGGSGTKVFFTGDAVIENNGVGGFWSVQCGECYFQALQYSQTTEYTAFQSDFSLFADSYRHVYKLGVVKAFASSSIHPVFVGIGNSNAEIQTLQIYIDDLYADGGGICKIGTDTNVAQNFEGKLSIGCCIVKSSTNSNYFAEIINIGKWTFEGIRWKLSVPFLDLQLQRSSSQFHPDIFIQIKELYLEDTTHAQININGGFVQFQNSVVHYHNTVPGLFYLDTISGNYYEGLILDNNEFWQYESGTVPFIMTDSSDSSDNNLNYLFIRIKSYNQANFGIEEMNHYTVIQDRIGGGVWEKVEWPGSTQ